MTSRNRIEFGKAHKILREIASLISDVVFLFYKINLDKVFQLYTISFSGKTVGREPGEGNSVDPAELGLTEGGETVQRRIRMSSF